MAMTAMRSILAAALAASALSACAGDAPTTPEIKTWTGGDAAHLSADQAACHKETDSLDAGQANAYSDPSYGVASALIEGLDRGDPMRDHRSDARAAAFITCMTNKGWRAG